MEYLERVGGGRPVWDRRNIHVPETREFLDVPRVVPVAEAGQIPVGTGLPRILRARLPVHVQDTASWLADHAAHKIDVVDLNGCGSGLHGLIDPLQARRQQGRSGTQL